MTRFAEYDRYDATGLAELVRTGAVTPLALVETAIARIEADNPSLNAVIRPLFERAREAARGALPDGPFRGVPYLVNVVTDPDDTYPRGTNLS